MMKRFRMLGWLALGLSLGTMHLKAGEIQGLIQNEISLPVPGISIFMKDSLGAAQMDVSDINGQFKFPNLPPGLYELRIVTPPGVHLNRPTCTVFEVPLVGEETVSLLLQVITTGVSVDFGKPASGGTQNLFPDPVKRPYEEPFALALRLWDFNQNELMPNRLELMGRFYQSRFMEVEIDEVLVGERYIPGMVEAAFTYGVSGLFTITVTAPSFPYLSLNGDVVIIKGRVISNDGNWLSRNNKELCLCIESLFFYRGGTSMTNWQLIPFTDRWGQCAQVYTP